MNIICMKYMAKLISLVPLSLMKQDAGPGDQVLIFKEPQHCDMHCYPCPIIKNPQNMFQPAVKRRYMMSLGNLVTVPALGTALQNKHSSCAWRSTRRAKHAHVCMPRPSCIRLIMFSSCIKPTSAGVNTPRYTIFPAYFLLFAECLLFISQRFLSPFPLQ